MGPCKVGGCFETAVRTGDDAGAADALEMSVDLGDGGSAGDWFFLAMICARQDRMEEANRWFDQAAEWTEEHAPENEELARFRDEARISLGR